MNAVKGFLLRHPAAFLAVAAFLAYLPGLGAADLVNDEAKDALNVPYPHPPLARSLVALSLRAFGWDELAARLPAALLGAASVGVMFLLLERLFRSRRRAAAGAILYALLPPIVLFSRSAYLSVPLAFFWTVGLLGIARLAERQDDAKGHALLAVGLAGGLWSQFQGVLFVPVWLLVQWRALPALRMKRELAWISAAAAAHLLAFGAYVASQPAILADLFTFLRPSALVANDPRPESLAWLTATEAGRWALTGAILLAAAVLARRRHPLRRTFEPIALLMALGILLFFARPADYYAPYLAVTLVPTALLLADGWTPKLRRLAFGFVLGFCLVNLPQAYVPAPDRTFWKTHGEELRQLTDDEVSVIVLGDIGYEVRWYLAAPVRSYPALESERARPPLYLVFRPETLDRNERALLDRLRLDRTIDGMATYRPPTHAL